MKLEFGVKPEFVWSASRLEKFLTCPYSYYLQYIQKPRAKTYATGPLAMGKFLHRRAEKFYTGRKFKSAEFFANSAAGYWKRYYAKTNKMEGKQIKWRDDEEKWILADEIKKISEIFYNNFNQEKPIDVEHGFTFILGKREFTGSFDEIRKGGIIRDHKSDRYPPTQLRLDNDLQFTIYALALSSFSKNKNFTLKYGIPKEIGEQILESKGYISEHIYIEFHFMRAGEIFKSNRTDEDFNKLCLILDNIENQIKRREFTPNTKSCGRCLCDLVCDINIPRLREQQQLTLFEINKKPQKSKNLKLKFPRKKRKAL